MARSVNRVFLIGNVGADPDYRETNSGTNVAAFSLATSYKRGDKERTEWHRVKAFGKLAEIVDDYVRKGARVWVEGRISYSTSENDKGEKTYWTDIIADEIIFLDTASREPGEDDGEEEEPPVKEKPKSARKSASTSTRKRR